ncbi:hypothetical protein BPOR_1003g00010 [Botrytis porri]|uniref:Uncharacterized protein n=1 Tax=Botrytis porri TaxID=87229 RepID=A0A4Z1KKV7_9HELO|nr:hypothetical protein BPOR_1003g00010 [Botrytis porri]
MSSSHSTSNTRSTRAAGSRVRDRGSSRGRESGNGDEDGQNQQSDVVLESTIDSAINTALLQDAEISDLAGLNPGLIPQDPDASKPQEGKVKEFDTDHYKLNMVGTTKKSAKSSNAEERIFKGSGISSLKQESLDLQGPLNLQSPMDGPTSYSEDITLLEHRVLQLGQNTFQKIEEDVESRRYVLSLRKLGYGTEPFTPLSATSDQQLRINDYMQALTSNEWFCNSSTYNNIVADKDRPKVLNVRPISMPSLSLLLELLREVQEFIRQEDNQRRDSVLEDVAEILLHMVVSLSLGIPQTVLAVNKHNLERQQDICHLLSSILSVVHVALLSHVRPHFDNSGYTPSRSLSDGLHIECPGGALFLAARRLKYHLAELWGPLKLNCTEASTASSIETHGGRLLSAEHDTSSIQQLESQVLCHWSSWMETNSLGNTTPIDTTKLLLIGVRDISQPARESLSSPRFDERPWRDCPDQYISQPRHREFELGVTYKFDAGWNLKDVILEDWVHAGKTDASHTPNPYLMDCLAVLHFSCWIGDDKNLQAWDITSLNRNDGRRLVPSQSNDQALTDTVLQTPLCITAAQKINRSLAASEKDAETQDTQSSSSATFSFRWAVNRSRATGAKFRQSADRYQTMNSDSRQPPPADQFDAEKKLLERINRTRREDR